MSGDVDRLHGSPKAYVLRPKSHHAHQQIIQAREETHEWNLGPAAVDQTNDEFLQDNQHTVNQHAVNEFTPEQREAASAAKSLLL